MKTEQLPMGKRYVPDWSFGDRVRKIRRDAGLGQVAFAEQVQVSSATVAAWETSTNNPRNVVSIAQRLELSFGVPSWWTLGISSWVPEGTDPDEASEIGLPIGMSQTFLRAA